MLTALYSWFAVFRSMRLAHREHRPVGVVQSRTLQFLFLAIESRAEERGTHTQEDSIFPVFGCNYVLSGRGGQSVVVAF